jgi:hypothetical protein
LYYYSQGRPGAYFPAPAGFSYNNDGIPVLGFYQDAIKVWLSFFKSSVN